ncbi:MAG: hypothetical protein K8S25_05475 [Alphaproteobacteria bacterium]|nr:hypothetical protein [Alphaproteobacteria bacterium]
MKSKSLSIVAIVVAGVQLSACASIIKGSTASIGVTSPPVTGAICTLNSSQGSWQMTTPGSVTVERSKNDLQISCKKEGYQDAFAVIPSNFEGWTVGNLIFGGIVGVGVDAATGAMNDYPNAFQVPMTPLTSTNMAPIAPPTAAPIAPVEDKPKKKPGA